ncbi:hypothetical protein K493DRAFT_317929 [Basidiobolus meristosporus CBS 931.73]|uniref:Hyaluronan/mRNA-binding protein domain-containing protein n=1 Tax=Basidiobolus meristosporus CBS 931.73 TaxID=1314790 RepID=A0A1Y1XXW7_9FUNG|nr:hypothetical protein K493DRAFT_317929 [Basidiobolus meristosporus CBS 931.73]|eukprot:ORX90495.1 hypothetical protein K493DRAFT_317929 [Basidiobolus meristosporus CBS 931.73]
MSVVSRNFYDLLNEDGEEVARIISQKSEKKTSNTAKKSEKKVEPRARSDYPQRGGKKVVPVARTEARREYSDRDFTASKHGRGGRSEGSHQGGRSGFPSRGREFDRKSATGKVDSEKKIHQSWGDAATDIQEGEKIVRESRGEGGRPENQVERVTVAEPEDTSKTLDEYYAEKTGKLTAKGITLPEARKPNEGADDAQWKSGVQLQKQEEEYYSISTNKKSKSKKEKKDKIFVGIEQRFTDGRKQGYEGRGGRGGRNSGVNVDDKSAFPSLA